MKIRISKNHYNSTTVCKDKPVYRESITKEIDGKNVKIFTDKEILPSNIETQKEAHEYLQNKIGDYQLILNWSFQNKNLKRFWKDC